MVSLPAPRSSGTPSRSKSRQGHFSRGLLTAGVAFRRDGQQVAIATRGVARIDIGTGLEASDRIDRGSIVSEVAYSPDGKLVLAARSLVPDDVLGEVRAYDSNTGKPIGGPLLHPKSVKSIVCNSEDRIIATGGADKKVRLWDWPVPVTGDAKRVTAWIEVITGMEMDESGTVKPLDPTGWNQRKARLQALGGPPPILPL